MSSYMDVEQCLFVYPYMTTTALLSRYSSQQSNRRENDIERLKRRIETLVKSNDDKERKIEDLQIQLAKYHTITIPQIPSINTKKVDNSVNNHNIQKCSYDTDGDVSDSNSLPSLNSDKDSKLSQKPLLPHNDHDSFTNSHQNPLSKLKLDILHRASSAEPMLIREFTNTPIRDISTKKRTLTLNDRMNYKYDQSGYVSDGPSRKYSIYKKSLATNLDKNKSSSVKGLKNIFGRIIRTNSGHFKEDDEQKTQTSFQNYDLRSTINYEKNLSKQLRKKIFI
ncbi:unnamed protein product [Rotaria sp. Silwood2]|nr:unnamed protein product [Rotaria sp. Silwood2]CAF4553147.1 unnamed protein product [Rotaria sp. Silwood2]